MTEERDEAIRALVNAGVADPHKSPEPMPLAWWIEQVLERWQGASDDCERAERERDEARAEVERLRGRCLELVDAAIKLIERDLAADGLRAHRDALQKRLDGAR